jgi:hypothetical protein
MTDINGQATLQIAETRFAIKCDYPPFMDWLRQACGDFLVEGEPHARLSLTIVVTDHDQRKPAFRVSHGFVDGETYFIITWRRRTEPDTMFRTILDMCLHSCNITRQSSDLWIHASGVIHKDRAYIFTGPSGAGKSTIIHILASEPGFTVLHDEVVAISQSGQYVQAWSSPLRGTIPASVRQGAPLGAIFFLKQAESNSCIRLGGGKVVANLVKTAKAVDKRISKDQTGFINLLMTVAERVPVYELHFKPDFSFWQYIEQVLLEPSMNARKG